MLPGADLSKLLIVPTCQRSTMDLVRTGEDVDVEKDKLLEQVRAPNGRSRSILGVTLRTQGRFCTPRGQQ